MYAIIKWLNLGFSDSFVSIDGNPLGFFENLHQEGGCFYLLCYVKFSTLVCTVQYYAQRTSSKHKFTEKKLIFVLILEPKTKNGHKRLNFFDQILLSLTDFVI
jgi:hypothetical protein